MNNEIKLPIWACVDKNKIYLIDPVLESLSKLAEKLVFNYHSINSWRKTETMVEFFYDEKCSQLIESYNVVVTLSIPTELTAIKKNLNK